VRVAFLGPSGTFAEEALRSSAPDGVEEIPYPTIFEAVMAVENGEVESAVVPIENSIEGSVNATLDALAVDAPSLRIVAEVDHPVHQTLFAPPGVSLDEVTRVLSHPQATAQSARFLSSKVPGAQIVSTPSTAEAVRMVMEAGEKWAAVGPRLAGDLYGAAVLAEKIEDYDGNLTRFVWLAREGTPPHAPPTKTSVVFWGFDDRSPGALVGALAEFADRGINLWKIESRPRRTAIGHYMFFADLDGPDDGGAVSDALDALRSRVEVLRVLGSYPAAVTRS
jgi:prephenate dehydratase